ncbi:MAG TPA: hypothetical protein VGI77_03550 [Gaiellaceae bacterium]|jgi:hypothetical protein
MIALAGVVAVVTFSPNPSHFGQLVHAHVQSGGTPSFKPFIVRSQHGDDYVLQCLDAACLPTNGPRTIHVAGASVVIVPRVTAAQVQKPLRSFHRETAVPPTSYRIAPRTVRTVSAVAILLLLAAAFALLWPVLRRLVPKPRDERTPLERALDLLRASMGRDVPDRRRALDLLARVAETPPVAEDALDLAWSRPAPDERKIETLIERVGKGA